MRKIIFSILLSICFAFPLISQGIKYKAVFIDQCSGEEKFLSYSISNGESSYFQQGHSGIIKLPGVGSYNLFVFDYGGFDDELEFKLSINESSFQTDTFFIPRVQLSVYISNPPTYDYFVCDNLANGFITDYFYNGQFRKRGRFKNGKLHDTLNVYHRNGNLKKVYVAYGKKYELKRFDKSGILYFHINTKKGFENEFYKNGKLKKQKTWKRKRNKISILDYYENGTIKSKQLNKSLERYSKNGKLIESIRRKKMYWFFDLFSKDKLNIYKHHWKMYDVHNKVKLQITFERDNNESPTFPISINNINLDEFHEILVFENGLPINKLVFDPFSIDDDIKFYFKENGNWKLEKTVKLKDWDYSIPNKN